MRVANGTSAKVREVMSKTGKSEATVYRWRKQGCDLSDPASVQQFSEGNRLRQNPNLVRGPAKSNRDSQKPRKSRSHRMGAISDDLGPIGCKGAAAALTRLEQIEEQAYVRLQRALEAADPFKLRACQEFYLKSSESLRRLDLSIEVERRVAAEKVLKKEAEGIFQQISHWLCAAFEQFLSTRRPA
jgi:hypothetical protein